MSPRIREHLQFLFGEAAAGSLLARVESLCDQYRAKEVPALPTGLPLTQQDALLITYAGQVQEPGRAPLAALGDFTRQHCQGLIRGIHLLPFYPWSSDDGFSVKDYFTVEPAYGTWADVNSLSRDFDLMFDGVFNHLSVQSDWFRRFLADEPGFRNFFITVEGQPDLSSVIRPRALPLLTEFETTAGPKKVWTTFSADQADLNFKNPEVLLKVLEALLFYTRQGARFIRLDAIAFLWKEIGGSCLHLPQTHRVVQLMRAVLDETAPDVLLITETNVPHQDNISYFGDGENEAQLVYNFALPPLVLHAIETGNASTLTHWAQSLALPSNQVAFFNFLASHDGIGLNPARGLLPESEIEGLVRKTLEHGGLISYKRMADGSEVPYEMNINFLDALSNPLVPESDELAAARFMTAQAIMLSLQGMPGIYFHSLFGSRGDRAGANASGIKRRINREKTERAGLEAELAAPGSLRNRVFSAFRDLLGQRREHPAFAPASPQIVLDLAPSLFAVLRESPAREDRMLCLHNVSSQPCSLANLPGRGLSDAERRLCSNHGFLGPFEFLWLPLPV